MGIKKITVIPMMVFIIYAGISITVADLNGRCKLYADEMRIVTAQAGLRMRKTPDSNGKVIFTIPYGESVEITDEKSEIISIGGISGKWTRVIWNKQEGWVFGGFLSVAGTGDKNISDSTGNSDFKSMIGKSYINEGSTEWDSRNFIVNKDGTVKLYNGGNSGMYSITGKYQVLRQSPIKLKVTVTDVISDYGSSCPVNKKPFIMEIILKGNICTITSERPECGQKWEQTKFIEEK